MTEKIHRVFIVEDHPMVREHLIQLIDRQPDLTVCGEADTLLLGKELIRSLLPDLAIVDLTLHGGSGLDLIKTLRILSVAVPILVLSMHDETIYAERALSAGARGYITKHRGSPEVLIAIRRVLAGEIYVSEQMISKVLRKMTTLGTKTTLRLVDRLTDRELSVLEMIGRGKSSRLIAETLGLAGATVDTYRARIKEKMNLQNAFELQHFAIQWLRERES